MLEQEKIVPAFSSWGFVERGKMNNQVFGDCPFCEKEGKFYLNQKTALWDCKVCGISGNYLQFLEKISKQNSSSITEGDFNSLAKDRGLPVTALKGLGIGVYGKTYTLPIYNEFGKFQDLRRFRLGKQMRASVGCNTGLWGIEKLKEAKIVYVCEGEWDGIALRWLLGFLNKPGTVVAVPGANTFKNEWVQHFNGKEVFACYDCDEAGELGDLNLHHKLKDNVKSIQHLHWSGKLPSGFDIRDLISIEAIKERMPKKTYKALLAMFKPFPVKKDASIKVVEKGELKRVEVEEVYEIFKKFLFLKNTDGIQIMLATVMANYIEGDPIWMFLVAPPGSAKTEIVQALGGSDKVYAVSSLTPHALISGASFVGGGDPSLIPKLNNKVLGIKDFTTIMELRENERDEIFGILRDSYDGHCNKIFGNGIKRSYESKFGIIAGVTPVIYHLDAQNQSLGERFLKFSIETNLNHLSEDEIITRAISNINREKNMRTDIAKVVADFIDWKYSELESNKFIPTIPQEIKLKIIALAKYGSRMRGTVSRDKYRTEMINSRPSSEIGSRLGKQIAKLSQALALVNGRREVNEEDYRLIRKCMLDTISQRMEDIVCFMNHACLEEDDVITTKAISQVTKYPQSTIARCLADMFMLEIVKRSGKVNKYEWTISPYMRKIIQEGEIYPVKKEEKRKVKLERI